MIKETIEYIVGLSNKENKIIKDQHGKEWYDINQFQLRELKPLTYYPNTLNLHTLSSLVEYIHSGLNGLNKQNLIVIVESPTTVKVYTEDDDKKERTCLVSVNALVPEFDYEHFMSIERFNIQLQSKFIDISDRKLILEFSSAIRLDKSAELKDDGISQITTIKDGAASVSKAIVPNPVTLVPRRTFLEIKQPSSTFVFRMNKEANLALFEADGGAWKYDAIQSIAEYLSDNLNELSNITILA